MYEKFVLMAESSQRPRRALLSPEGELDHSQVLMLLENQGTSNWPVNTNMVLLQNPRRRRSQD